MEKLDKIEKEYLIDLLHQKQNNILDYDHDKEKLDFVIKIKGKLLGY
jgi:hypothetical protein